jgi:hypothetical protein
MTAPNNILKRYPAGPITPAAAYYLLNDKTPLMNYRSWDDTCVFSIYGSMAIYDRTLPESVQVTDMKGLVPPWQNITQKGATQDGETYITSLYDPCQVDITCRVRGRDGKWTRRVQRDWIASWDAIKPGELSWFSHDLGRWWAKVRWSKAMADKLTGGNQLPQSFIWSAIAYDAFWRSYDSTDSFGYSFDDASDVFNSTTSNGLTGWTIHYSNTPAGGWLFESNTMDVLGIPLLMPNGGGMAQWADDPDNALTTEGVDAVAIYDDFTSATDDQVVSITLGSIPGTLFFYEAYNDIWFRTPPPGTATPGSNGLRLRFGWGVCTLSYFIGSTETVLRTKPIIIPPYTGETWTVICSGRTWTVQRGTANSTSTVMTVTEIGTESPMGSGNRCAGMGVHAALDTPPAGVLSWSAGDNNVTEAQSGYVNRVNMGDQPMFDRWTLVGPGVFNLGNGPNATEFVTVGSADNPVLDGQVLQVRTDPRKRGITDITSQVTAQQLTAPQQALEQFLSLAIGDNTSPLVEAIQSLFGITAPQGNVYTLLNGRFSDDAAIPPKPVAGPVQSYEVPVSIEGGNANSKIMVAGTPLRRFPY